MPDVIALKGRKVAPKALRSTMETLLITPEQVNQWRVPAFQRPVRVTAKVQAIAEEMKADGVAITGIITLGRIDPTGPLYIVDGQHRIEAFRISGLPEIIADIRVINFDDEAEMADEFGKLNTSLVAMRPDDLLRALVPNNPALQIVIKACGFVGFDNIRRGTTGPIVGLSAVLRTWHASRQETPSSTSPAIKVLADTFNNDDATNVIRFLELGMSAWGRDPEYYRLWGNLNMALCMWLYRRMVLETNRKGATRVSVLTESQFKQAITALSANGNYLDWLPGRLLSDRDRSPAFQRMRTIMAKRLIEAGMQKPNFPGPAWSKSGGLK